MFLFETATSEGIPGTARLLPYEPQVPRQVLSSPWINGVSSQRCESSGTRLPGVKSNMACWKIHLLVLDDLH